MSHTDGATKKSLFIQVAWFNSNDLEEQLEHIRREHRDRNKDDYIFNVVLDEIGSPYGLSRNLDVIAPYLPNGSKKAFDNVFVGSSFVKFQGAGSAYSSGIIDGRHRWNNLRVQRDLWTWFQNVYPDVPFHFYINHEGVLNVFDIPKVRRGYEAYLIQTVRDAHSIFPNRALLWSPAIWSGGPLTSKEESAIGLTFRNVQKAAYVAGHDDGIKWLHLQDMMGRGRKDITKYDVRQWYRELKKVYKWDSLRINMEYFNQPASVIQAREDWYQSQGIAVGASWSLRHWYLRHKDL